MKKFLIALSVALFVACLAGIVVWKVLDQSASWQIPRLKDPNWKVRVRAADRLRELILEGKEAIPALLEALRKEDDQTAASYMATALSKVGPSIVPALIDILMESRNETPRMYAALALEEIGPAAKAAVPALLLQEAASGTGPYQGPFGRAAYEICKGKGEDVVLIELLKDPDVKTRLLAAKALATRTSVASVQQSAAPVLAEALKDPAAEVRKQAAITLGLYGIESEPAIPALQQAQGTDPDLSVRQAAAEALTKIH